MIGHQFQARTSDPSQLGGVLDWWLVKLSQGCAFHQKLPLQTSDQTSSSLTLTSQGLYDGAESKSLRYTEETSIVSWLLPRWSRIWESEAKSNTKPKPSQAQLNREGRRSSSDAEGNQRRNQRVHLMTPMMHLTLLSHRLHHRSNLETLCLNPTYTSGAQSIRGGRKTDDLCDSHFCTN